jgi:hypothetical protein
MNGSAIYAQVITVNATTDGLGSIVIVSPNLTKVCTKDNVCDAVTLPNTNATCYNSMAPVIENYALCDITNKDIIKKIEDGGKRKPQISWSCNAATAKCNFQFWVDELESFFCGLEDCAATKGFKALTQNL